MTAICNLNPLASRAISEDKKLYKSNNYNDNIII